MDTELTNASVLLPFGQAFSFEQAEANQCLNDDLNTQYFYLPNSSWS